MSFARTDTKNDFFVPGRRIRCFLLTTFLFLPAFAQKPELVVQSGLPGAAVSVAFSPDGRTVAGSGRETIVLWDRSTGRQLRTISVQGLSPSVVFSPDSRSLASVDITGVINLWDVATGRNQDGLGVPCTLAGCLVAFTPNGDAIAALGDTGKGVQVWNVSSGKMLHRLGGRDTDGLVMTPDARIVAATEHDRNQFVTVWDVASGKKLRTIPLGPFYSSEVPVVALSPDGSKLALNQFNRIALWTIGGDKLLDFAIGGEKLISFTPSGDALVTKSWNADGTIRLWDVSSGRQLKAFGENEHVWTVSFSADGKVVALGQTNGNINVRELESGRQLLALGQHVSGVGTLQFSRDGRLLANADLHTIRLISTETGAQVRSQRNGTESMAFLSRPLAFSPDSSVLAAGGDQPQLWELASGREITVPSTMPRIFSLAFSADGRVLAWGGEDQTVRLWEMPAAREVLSLDVRSKVSAVAVSPDGATVASGSWDGIVRVWDVASGRLLQALTTYKSSVDVLAFSPDGKTLAATSNTPTTVPDPTIFLWDMPGGHRRRTLQHSIFIAFSPDSVTLAAHERYAENASTSPVSVWDLASGRKLRTLARDPGSLFSADWKLAAASYKDAVQLSDPVTGKEIATLFALDENDWVVADPEGRFDTSTLDQINGIGWVFPDEPFHPLNPEVFMRDYYQPKLLSRLRRQEKLPEVRQLSDLNRAQPDVEILEVKPETDPAFVSVTVKAGSRTSATQKDANGKGPESGAFDLRLFRDRQMVGQWPEVAAAAEPFSKMEISSWRHLHALKLDQNQCTHVFRHIRLPRRTGVDKVRFTAYAFNSDRVKSVTTAPFEYDLPKLLSSSGFTRRAYIIAMGVNANQLLWNLDFAVPSAEEAARLLREKMAGEYEVVDLSLFSTLATDSPQVVLRQATKQNLKAVLDLLAGRPVAEAEHNIVDPHHRIQAATPDDAVILFVSSHGYADPQGSFYVVPYDTGAAYGVTEDLLTRCQMHPEDRSQSCQKANAFLGRTISSQELAAWWEGVDASDMIMILDSCHSAAVAGREFRPGPLGDAGLGQLSYDKGMRILTATQPDKTARATMVQESAHSLLVEALLEEARTHSQESLFTWLSDAGRQIAAVTHRLYPELSDADLQVPELFDFNVNGRSKAAAALMAPER